MQTERCTEHVQVNTLDFTGCDSVHGDTAVFPSLRGSRHFKAWPKEGSNLLY